MGIEGGEGGGGGVLVFEGVVIEWALLGGDGLLTLDFGIWLLRMVLSGRSLVEAYSHSDPDWLCLFHYSSMAFKDM
jgi:hypothetical protein